MHYVLRRSVVAFQLLFVCGSLGAATFSLEEILSSPFPSGLTTSDDTAKLAWVFNHKGGRDVWVAEGPNYVGRPLTDLTADDGQDLTSLTWSPGGRRLAFVRGGPANSAGEIPNPAMDPLGVERAVYVVRLENGREQRIDDGSSPLFMADDRGLLYLKEGKIWLASLTGDETTVRAQLIDGRGSFGSLALSHPGSPVPFSL